MNRLGQPEVNIGLLPGGGGVVRLPRVAGLKNALDIITTGNHVTASQALKMGILDTVGHLLFFYLRKSCLQCWKSEHLIFCDANFKIYSSEQVQ